MASEAQKTLIGAFILGALVLAAAGTAFFGAGVFFKNVRSCVLYFEGSVKGLTLGAPVQMKGVTIGKVSAIQLIFDPNDLSVLNRVVVEITPGLVESSDPFQADSDRSDIVLVDILDQLVARGLRAKLMPESFVTGKLLVSLDFFPDTAAKFYGFEKKFKELPTVRSDLEAFARTLEEIPFQEMAQNLNQTIIGIEKIVTSPNLMDTVRQTRKTLHGIEQLTQNIDERSAVLSAGIDETLKQTRSLITHLNQQSAGITQALTASADEAREVAHRIQTQTEPLLKHLSEMFETAKVVLLETQAVLSQLRQMTAGSSPLMYHTTEAMQEMAAAAANLGSFVDYLNRHPEALIHGKRKPGDMP